ncbi:MAG TPA: glycosyl hydrolase family 65 protein [Phycisphaerae bacterium]|nr:glycosyl hydrolase family 65 protein [Phycisphaerae bacterium]
MTNEWTLTERPFRLDHAKAYEGLFTLGSGYLHVRGSLEEHIAGASQNLTYDRRPANVTSEKFPETKVKWGTFVPGVWGGHPALGRELVNLPHTLAMIPFVDGERLDITVATIDDYRRTLHMDKALLERSFIWNTRSGKSVRVTFETFVSGAHRHVILQRMTICCSQAADVIVRTGIDADVRTNGYDHFRSVQTAQAVDGVTCHLETDQGDTIEICSESRGPGRWYFEHEPRAGWSVLESHAAANTPFVIEKRTAIATSRDLESASAQQRLAEVESMDFDALKAEHVEHWRSRWATCDIEIDGDEDAQRSVRAALYHLLRVHVPDDSRVAIDPKGYAGDAYWGRYFWDTEMFLAPFYAHTAPARARTLVDYRVQSLPGARRNADRYGYAGARYAWEADDRGDECCPNWQYADHEVHVTADVAHGFAYYARATNDEAYLQGPAALALVEMARYWRERVDWRPGDEYPSLLGVMGPDEFTPISNNNAYTNALVSQALDLAATYGRAGGATEEEIAAFREISDRLPLLRSNDGVLILQCEEFDSLAEPHFEKRWRDRSRTFAAQVSQERLYRSKSLKQADVLMLMMLTPGRFRRDEIERAWDYYVPYTTHDSSLSAGVHAIVAARLGRSDDAWDFWRRASSIDLDVAHGGASEGVHIANAGAVWQMVVLGFAGMQSPMETNKLTLDPNPPAHWSRIRFPLCWRGARYDVQIEGDRTEVTNLGESPSAVIVAGVEKMVDAKSSAAWGNE